MATTITFQTEEIKFVLKEKLRNKAWLLKLAKKEQYSIAELNYIFCSDEYLLNINVEYLNHDTYTDIITFPYAAEPNIIEGDIFISIDRVRENANTYQVPFDTELRRVIIHGVLHLCGYGDKSPQEELAMRAKEDEWLAACVL